MVNQTEFNEEYKNKEILIIKFKNEDFEEEQLIIADYSNLEKLILQNIDNLDKLILRNLPKLTKCSVSDCKLKELIIENCDQIKELEVDDNQLTNLNFLPSLPNLQKLNVDGNPDLASGLEFLPQGIKFSCDNTKIDYHEEENEELAKLQKENQKLKETNQNLEESKKNLKKAIKEKVVDQLDEQLDKINQRLERSGSFSQAGNTDELTAVAGQVVKNLKGINENLKNELSEQEAKIHELENKLQEQVTLKQKKELELQVQKEKAEDLKKEWKEALKESAKNDSASTDKKKWEQKASNLEKSLNEVEKIKNRLEGELVAVKDEVENLRKYMTSLQENKLVSADNLPTNIYQLTVEFLKTKDYFYLARKNTITNLQDQIQQLESKLNQLGKMNFISDFIIKVGSFTSSIDHGITATLGKGLKNGTNLLNSTYISQQGKEVQLILQNSEEETNNIQQLDYVYSQLNSALQGRKDYDLFYILENRHHSAFKIDYLIYDILMKNTNIWENRKLNQERMEQIYTVLQTNLTELDKEINSEFLKLKSEDQTQIRKDNELRIEANQTIVINKDQRIQELEEQIANEEKELKLLINSVNEKLESKKKFVSSNEKAKITQERHQLFEQFLTTGFIDSKLKSMSEDKKINLSEITNLQNSIKNSREQLNSYQLENQVVQLEINKL